MLPDAGSSDAGPDADIDASRCPTACQNEHGSADCTSGV